jgi:peptidoglycan/LPS O-acetylase OafA/YrhL
MGALLILDFYSQWPFFAGLLLLYGLASLPILRAADSPPSPRGHRLLGIDGLRGFLAFAVVFHHLAVYHLFLAQGRWALPPSHFYSMLGPLGVSVFFLITSYLFWSRVLRDRGRTKWRQLYIGRVFRIGPLYLVAIACLVFLVLSHDGFHLRQPLAMVVAEILAWCSLGLLYGPNINHTPESWVWLAGVTWSIQWEWFFYLSLPVLAMAARFRHVVLLGCTLAAVLLAASLFPGLPFRGQVLLVSLFLAGMLCASLAEQGYRLPLKDWQSSLLVVGMLLLVFRSETVYAPGPVVLLSASFYLVTQGCSLFHLLTSRPALRMGDVSYGIYLLQGLILAAVLRPSPMKRFALASPAHFWLCGFGSAALLLVVAVAAHVVVERPGIAWGRRLAASVTYPPSAGR